MNLINSLIPTFNRTPVASQGHRHEDLGPTTKPVHEIKQTDDAFGVTVHLPGVAKHGLEITSDAETLRIVGKRAWTRPESWTSLHRETSDATFLLELEHDNRIDADKIHAELRDGVLYLSLPKTAEIKPRRIAIA